ncbi:MAG: hypothetical protein PARBA_03321 [Parabacteroides sp.]
MRYYFVILFIIITNSVCAQKSFTVTDCRTVFYGNGILCMFVYVVLKIIAYDVRCQSGYLY